MPLAIFRILCVLAGLAALRLQAQTVQPGLEAAVKWKWWVQPSDEKDWGLPQAEPAPPVAVPVSPIGAEKKDAPAKAQASIAPGDYEVKRGDALAIIARKAGVSVANLKRFNAMSKDIIRIGQKLKIPTSAEVTALTPPPPPPPPPKATPAPAAQPMPKKRKRGSGKGPAKPPVELEIDYVAEATRIEVFLDRENFSGGAIDGNDGAAVQMMSAIFRSTHPDLQTPEALRAKAGEVVDDPFTTYKLKESDFRFISPPKIVPPPVVVRVRNSSSKNAPIVKPPPRPTVTYDDLAALKFAAYRTPWEFVAERFHCDEAFLRSLNPNHKTTPAADTDFKVPAVVPFEIEKCFAPSLRPAADPKQPVVASIVEYSRLEIRRSGKLIAAMPLSRARPDLRGKGTWLILNAIAGPRMATRQEVKTNSKTVAVAAVAAPASPATGLAPAAPAPTAPVLAADQILAAGPKNPVGVFWINLTKADSGTPLPYGLHGTAIPNRMKSQESIGGLRMSNWDIARAVRLLPEGTPLTWK